MPRVARHMRCLTVRLTGLVKRLRCLMRRLIFDEARRDTPVTPSRTLYQAL
jgi:hypothetical protein